MSLRGQSLRLGGYFSAELLLADALVAIGLNPQTGLFANSAGGKYFLHRSPVGLNPAAIVPAIAMWRYADLCESEPRTRLGFLNIENGDRIMIGPPTGCPPGLNNFATRFQREIVSCDVPIPGSEWAALFFADFGLFAG